MPKHVLSYKDEYCCLKLESTVVVPNSEEHKMTDTIDSLRYGKPQHEVRSTPPNEQQFYGEPQHEIPGLINIELRESVTYLRLWRHYAEKQRQREIRAKRPMLYSR
ncbi:hypothetical protein HAL_31340 [Haladaptatus sp. T7]|nr:hypothetical protein HAL_31340 [Haladaptatus sp. T7]